MKISLEKEEARWLSRNILKTKTILEAASKKDPQVLERKTYKTIASLSKDAGDIASVLDQLGDEPFEFDLLISRKQQVMIYTLLQKTESSLTNTILPVYKKRGMEDYAADVERKIVLIKAMQRKFK